MKKFHGQILVDVREFYMDKLSQEVMPGIPLTTSYQEGKILLSLLYLGKKGISLTLEQLKHFKSLFPELDDKFPSFSSSDKPFYDPLA